MTQTVARPAAGPRLRGYQAGAALLVGVIIVPFALSVIFNSYSSPDSAAYVRTAFASVAGSTIAIATVIVLLAHRLIRRSAPSSIGLFGVIAVVVTLWQLQVIASAARFLLNGLGL